MKSLLYLISALTLAACTVEPAEEPASSEASQELTNGICVRNPPGTRSPKCLQMFAGSSCITSAPNGGGGSVVGICTGTRFVGFDESGLSPQLLECICKDGPALDF
jgi:hypothetical protein